MLILRNLGLRRAIKEFPLVIISKIIGTRRILRFLFSIHNGIEDSIDYISILREDDEIHPKHRLMGYHEFFIVRIKEGERVLDIGCGNGIVAFDIAKSTGAYVTGIDKEKTNILSARSKWKHHRLNFVLGDALLIPSQRKYDVIILSNVLEHIENRIKFLERLLINVQPNRILVRVPLYDRHWHTRMKEELGMDYRLDNTHFIEYTKESFYYEIERAGLSIKECEYCWGEIWAELTTKVRRQ